MGKRERFNYAQRIELYRVKPFLIEHQNDDDNDDEKDSESNSNSDTDYH